MAQPVDSIKENLISFSEAFRVGSPMSSDSSIRDGFAFRPNVKALYVVLLVIIYSVLLHEKLTIERFDKLLQTLSAGKLTAHYIYINRLVWSKYCLLLPSFFEWYLLNNTGLRLISFIIRK